MSDLLKSLVQHIINDDSTAASDAVRQYLLTKTREIVGESTTRMDETDKKHYIESNGSIIAGPFNSEDEAEQYLDKLLRRAKPEDEMDNARIVFEAKNHMDETEYTSYDSWKAALKKKFPGYWIDGDKEIANAMVGPKPYKRGETKSVGEWDGEVGVLYKN
jgi:hypothetical protein